MAGPGLPPQPLVMTLQLDTGPLLTPFIPTVFGICTYLYNIYTILHFIYIYTTSKHIYISFISNYLYLGLGAGLGWLLSRLTLAVSELGSPEVNVPVTFTNTNNPVITVMSFTSKCCRLDTFLRRCRRMWTPAPPTPTTTRTASPRPPPPPTRTPTGAGGGEQWCTLRCRGAGPGQHRASLSVPPGGCCSSTNIY